MLSMPRCAAQQDGAAGRFVDAAGLHADEAVLHQIEPADAVGACPARSACVSSAAGDSVTPSIATGSPRSKSIAIDRRLVRRVLGPDGALIDDLVGLHRRILQDLPFRRRVQQVGVDAERRLAALVLGDRDLVLLGEFQQPGAAGQVPFAPRRDDLDVRLQRVIATVRTAPGRCPCRSRRAPPRRRRPVRRSRSGAARSAGGRSRCRAGIGPRTARWRGTSGRRSPARRSRAGRR